MEDKSKFMKLIDDIFNPGLTEDYARNDEKFQYLLNSLANQLKCLKADRDRYKSISESQSEELKQMQDNLDELKEWLNEDILTIISTDEVLEKINQLENK